MNQKEIFALIDKFDSSELTEFKLEQDNFKITLKSGHPQTTAAAASALPVSAPAEAQTASAAAPASSSDTEIITSPIVGTFYRSPAPDAPAFAEEGMEVRAGDSLCIIEAMKIMNKLEAEFPCEIVRILAEGGQMVEYGTPLFEVKRT